MPTKSKAYTKFEKIIIRSVALIGTYRALIRIRLRDKNNNNSMPATEDLIRASVVISVAALDTYITDVFSEKLVPYIKKYDPGDHLIKILSDSGLDTKEALNLIKMERPYRRIRNLVEQYYSTYTTQRFEVIDKLFLAYGLKDISDKAQDKSGRITLKRSIAILIQRRHKIVHDGDYNSHGKLVKINSAEVMRRVNDVMLFVTCLDEIISKRI